MNSERALLEYVDRRRSRLVQLIQDLVRIPSENKPPEGCEGACQRYIAAQLSAAGWQPELYELDTIAGLDAHPLWRGGRHYAGRPNLVARRASGGGGRSLLLSGHIDTVPRGTLNWTRDPFGGAIEGDRLYGRGANDMKAGIAINLFLAEAVARLPLDLAGDLIFESVIDEEFGGVNGTLAGRVRGDLASAAILTEPSFLRICPAQRGGRTAHLTFRGAGGILSQGAFPSGAIEQVTRFLAAVPEFAAQRRARCQAHPAYAASPDPVPVTVTRISSGPWSTGEPIAPPEECRVEVYWQLMPGERQADVEREFRDWMGQFTPAPEIEFPIRWLPGSAIGADTPLVTELSASATAVLGAPPAVEGIEGPCDMYVFHEFGMPAVLWGPRGGNTHAADEYVEIESAVSAASALLLFIARWCAE